LHQVRERKKTLYASIIGTFPPGERTQENFVYIHNRNIPTK
jgi:G:T/U-mismatch repair DNA glycosylase